VGYAVYRYQQVGGGIMLMHDIHPRTEAALPAIITGLQGAGATFVNLADLAVFPNMNAWIDPPEAPACCGP
jgi:peptidoglycan/xylan/chitin deacetylase (PgdA/CDA1 family)